MLEESHVLQEVRPFAGGKRSELTSRPKVFFVDVGLRNQLVGDVRAWSDRTDRGAVLESWVFSELLKSIPADATVHFWRSQSGAEVDFVVVGAGRPLAIEVKAGALSRSKLSRSARSFIEAYEPERFVVVNATLDARDRLAATDLVFCRPEDLVAACFPAAR